MVGKKLLCVSPVYLPLFLDDLYVIGNPERIYKKFSDYCIIEVCLVGKQYSIIRKHVDNFGEKSVVIVNERGEEHYFPLQPDPSLADIGDGSYREFFELLS